MPTSMAVIPSLFLPRSTLALRASLITLTGIAALSMLAHLSFPLPFTPVPLTGQTFGVTLISLLYGRKLALATVGSYLTLGLLGLPVFAPSLASLGPTLGYLVGMFASSYVIGLQADRGATQSRVKCLRAGFSGSLLVYGFGLIGLTFFIPLNSVLVAGLLPFLPGDIFKTVLACSIARWLHRKIGT